MKFWNKIKQYRYGTLEFEFPDGRKLYRIKEKYMQKLPVDKILDIQANNNSLAFLGVAKDTLANAVDRIIKNSEQSLLMLEQKQDPAQKIGETLSVAKYIRINTDEHERIQEHIIVSIFDMFFFFEGESYFEKSMETMELKRHYLRTYPYFNSFFFRKVENYLTAYGLALKNCTRTALVLSTVQAMQKALSLEDIQLENASLS